MKNNILHQNAINVYHCPVFRDLFGGTDLTFIDNYGVKFVLCPCCRRYHAVDNNNQIIEGMDYGTSETTRKSRIRA